MGKQSFPRRVADNEALAILRNLRVSPQKLNLVVRNSRNGCQQGCRYIIFSRRRIAGDVRKVLQSAMCRE